MKNKKKLKEKLASVSANLGSVQGQMDLFVTKHSEVDKLKKQIEFYFGDPNLIKDKSMRKMISNHSKGYVKVEKLLNFKKIENILFNTSCCNIDDKKKLLLQAIKKSDVLKLNKLGDLVKRRIPFDYSILNDLVKKGEIDRRMVYVENLPSDISHDNLANIFINHPKILHISLPRNANKTIKGFAFIEFDVIIFF